MNELERRDTSYDNSAELFLGMADYISPPSMPRSSVRSSSGIRHHINGSGYEPRSGHFFGLCNAGPAPGIYWINNEVEELFLCVCLASF